MADQDQTPPPNGPVRAVAGGLQRWWDRARELAARSAGDVRAAWAQRGLPAGPMAGKPSDPQAPTEALPRVRTGSRRMRRLAPRRDGRAGVSAGNALAASWTDPERRPWLLTGAASLAIVLAIIATGLVAERRGAPLLAGRATRGAPSAPPAAATAVPGAPPEAGGQPAAPAQPAPPPAQPPAEQPAPAPAPEQPGATIRTNVAQLGLAALPLLLGLFWLISAWLVDSEARRAFVVQEPWGERRTVAYSCLAVGCVFPLILAGLLFSAWGFVSFVLFVARRQSWVAGLQAGALILFVCALVLLLRSAVARWMAERRAQRA